MDNKKIGKLIAELRKKQGLTQQDLGDKVGVGFRAVSKWERGITLPDISIINDLSKILGISSDELLSGEIKKQKEVKEKKKVPTKIKITITILISLFIIVTSIHTYYNNKTYTYNLYSANLDEYYIEGQVSFYKDKLTFIVNNIKFKNPELLSTKIKNYEYDIELNDIYLFRFGYAPTTDSVEQIITVEDFTKEFNINHNTKTEISKNNFLKNNINIKLRFLTENEEEINQNVIIKLYQKTKNNN